MKKILITAAALMAFLFAVQTAQAATVEGEMKLTVYGPGKAFVDGVDCGTGCTIERMWDDVGPAPTLTITTAPTKVGYTNTNWGNCNRLIAINKCEVDLVAGQTRPIYASFYDTQPPSIFIAGYSDQVGDTLNLNLNVSDNDAVAKVEYLVNDEVVGTRTDDYFHGSIDVTEVPEGVHAVRARAWDVKGNFADSASYDINFDHTRPEVELDSPLAATNGATASFNFDAPAEDQWWADCAIQKQGETVELEGCGYGEPFTAEVPTEGNWEFVVEVSDQVSNVTRVVHPFIVDRTAPVAQFTAGPAEGSEVAPGEVSFAWEANDDLAMVQTCGFDGTEVADCEGLSAKPLEAGDHFFAVKIEDAAGNVTNLRRDFSVMNGIDGPGPDETDRTAPVIRLVAPKQTVKSMRKALRLRVRCDEACAGKVVVAGKRGIRFSGRVHLMKAGVAKLKLRPTAKVRKRLVTVGLRSLRSAKPRRMTLTARASLSDRAGNTGKSALKFSVGA